MIFGMSVYQMAMYFIIYSFLGWVVEVLFHAVHMGKIVNRGFLNGPVCPIYGCGVLSVFMLIGILSAKGGEAAVENIPLWQLFIGGTLLATLIELAGGFALDKIFHARWWDYSDKPFNFHGYICLEFSLIWGIAITFVVRMIQPYFRQASHEMIPERIGWPILIVCYLLFITDLVVTVITVNHLNRRLSEADRIEKAMRTVSDGLTEVIGGGAVRTMEKIEAEKTRAQEAGEAVRGRVQRAVQARDQAGDRLKDELYGWLMRQRHFGAGRLLRAYPDLVHREHPDLVRELQGRLAAVMDQNRQ